jgi:DNA-binding transcriptional MerR regulator
VPSARSQGGFRLYTEPDVERPGVIERMKPLGFQLEEMRELLAILDALSAPEDPDRDAHLDRLAGFHSAAEERPELVGLNPHSENLHTKLTGQLAGSH